eukprot:6097733-Amphidinium_carterae.1
MLVPFSRTGWTGRNIIRVWKSWASAAVIEPMEVRLPGNPCGLRRAKGGNWCIFVENFCTELFCDVCVPRMVDTCDRPLVWALASVKLNNSWSPPSAGVVILTTVLMYRVGSP